MLISFFFALSLAASAHAQNLLSNPGFETGDFSSWSTNVDPVWDAVDTNSPHSGTYGAYFGNPATTGSWIYQDFPTVAGRTYTISFWYQAEPDPNNVSEPSELQVLFGSGSLIGTLGSCSGNCIWDSALLATSWTQVTLTVTATSSTSRIEFLAADQVAFIDLDDVSAALSPPSVTSVLPASGPVPGGTSVTITGTGFTGASAVKFGAIDAASYNVNSDTQITASSPAAAGTGTVDVTVTTAVATSAVSAADQFTYVTAAQTLTFGAAPTVKVNGTGTVTASSALPNSGNPITFSTTSTDCTVTSAGVVTGINAGTNNCVIVATQAADSNYNVGTASQTLSIGHATQIVTFGVAPTVRVNGTTTLAASSALPNSGNPITFSTTSTDCTVTSAGVVTGIRAGTNNCVIVATEAGNGSYDVGTATLTLSVVQDATTLTLVASPNPVLVGQSVTLTATVTGDPPTGAVTFCDGATTTNGSCTGGMLLCASALVATTATSSTATCTTTFSSAGTHPLSAFYAGDANYAATATAQALAEAVASPLAPTPVPLLSPWLLGLLGSLLAAIGLVHVIGNRRSQGG